MDHRAGPNDAVEGFQPCRKWNCGSLAHGLDTTIQTCLLKVEEAQDKHICDNEADLILTVNYIILSAVCFMTEVVTRYHYVVSTICLV